MTAMLSSPLMLHLHYYIYTVAMQLVLLLTDIVITTTDIPVNESSNYDLANDVCVWQSTPRTADVTKIAGYVRVRILMNW